VTGTELHALVEEFYKDTLRLVLALQAHSRIVTAYDANNAYQQVLGRQDVYLRWLADALDQLGTPPPAAPEGDQGTDTTPNHDQRALMDSDATAQQAFIEKWEPRVPSVSNARHRKMLELILGEMKEHLRVFRQAVSGRTDLLGRHADGKELSGSVLPARPQSW
jgi:hypothetical protein